MDSTPRRTASMLPRITPCSSTKLVGSSIGSGTGGGGAVSRPAPRGCAIMGDSSCRLSNAVWPWRRPARSIGDDRRWSSTYSGASHGASSIRKGRATGICCSATSSSQGFLAGGWTPLPRGVRPSTTMPPLAPYPNWSAPTKGTGIVQAGRTAQGFHSVAESHPHHPQMFPPRPSSGFYSTDGQR